MYIGFLRLKPEHYNTQVIKSGYKRIFDKYTDSNILRKPNSI